ncbi:MAG: pyridoxamine 5'-phosphate oxidase [Actinobacteria bacterium]|nr:pyridoxamine 5'-phosphate oxidase [Actinomycetota bacterium]MDQ3531184.1 pyridoxamine 5'-phosphate oxidase [Actinomycetota bacterium]
MSLGSDPAHRRRDYSREDLAIGHLDPDPIKQFMVWFRAAGAAGPNEPNAMTLATAGEGGRPSARVVLLKDVSRGGFVFYTNYESRKGDDLAENPQAALVFFWPEIERQVRVEGRAERVDRSDSEAYWRTRPRGAQLGAWASDQSRVIAGRPVLDDRLREVAQRYAGVDVPAPPHWGGWRIMPSEIEFWQGRPDRMHDRLIYRRAEPGWTVERLAP